MGMYTRLTFWAEVKDEAVPVLKSMVGDDEPPTPLPDHPFFTCDRWQAVGSCSSYYHQTSDVNVLRYDDIARAWFLNIDCSLKNYGGEIEEFLSWIGQHDNGDSPTAFRGIKQYEEDEHPTLIYWNGQGGYDLVRTTEPAVVSR